MPETVPKPSVDEHYIQGIVLEPGYDSESGQWGYGYSPDNGEHFCVLNTIYGRKFRQEDADRLYPFLKKYLGSGETVTQSLHWADILDKPELVTEDELTERLAGFQPVTKSVSWSEVTDKPDLALKSEIPSVDGFLKLSDLDGYVKETDLSKYATKDELQNIKTTPGKPGKDGKSAYEIAVAHGFVGSEEEWLDSLHGKNGTSSAGGDANLSIEAITDLIKQHIHATVDTTTGDLSVEIDDLSKDTIADAVAVKVAQSLTWTLTNDGELVAQIGGAK